MLYGCTGLQEILSVRFLLVNLCTRHESIAIPLRVDRILECMNLMTLIWRSHVENLRFRSRTIVMVKETSVND